MDYIGLAAYSATKMQWIPLLLFPVVILVCVLFALFAVHRARIAAVEWGSLVKAQIDTFLPVLRKRLGFPDTISREDEKSLWQLYSNVITYRSEDDLLKLNKEIDRLTRRSPQREELPNGTSVETLIISDQSKVEKSRTLIYRLSLCLEAGLSAEY
jgi:hypothetical protein